MLEWLTCLTFVGLAKFHGLLVLEKASRMLLRGWIPLFNICVGGLRGQNPVLRGLRRAASAVSAHNRRCLQTEHARHKRRVSQKQASYRQSPERGAEQRAGGTLHPARSSQHQELGCEPLEAHQPFCVWWTLCHSLNLKPFRQPEFHNDVYKHSMKTAI